MPIIRRVVKPGARFERLVVVEHAGSTKNRHSLWRCVCDCGREKIIRSDALKSGATTSCGCYQKEQVTIHGESANYIHRLWASIKQRCYDSSLKNYHLYGGRGITMYEPWRSDYLVFAAYIRENLGERPTEKHSLDRADNDGNYEPGNLRWATKKEQLNNRRTTMRLEHDGRTQTLQEWANETGIDSNTIWMRLFSSGWTVRAALSNHLIEYESKEVNNE